MTHIRSSWNSYKFAIIKSKNHTNKPHKRYYYAQYKGREVSVCNSRGKKRFTLVMDSDIVSAVIRDDVLVVETADQWIRIYTTDKGRLISETRPTPPAGFGGGDYALAA